MKDTPTKGNRELLGWAFLLTGFAIFVAVAVAVPLSIRSYLRNSTQPLATVVQANQGTVRIDDSAGDVRAVLAGEAGQSVEAGAEILTDASATALIFVRPPESDKLLARFQVYGSTNLNMVRLDMPRFEMSSSGQQVVLELRGGRISVTVPENEGRDFVTTVLVPGAEITLDLPGQYSFEVTNSSSQIAVQSGEASVVAGLNALLLTVDQRAVIPVGGGLIGPIDAERNLIANGDFDSGFANWDLFRWNVELADQPEGKMNVSTLSGESTLEISRQGDGHADVRLRQPINQDVTDFEQLQLYLTFRVAAQDLAVCGIQGSECPLMIRVNYVDQSGASRTWQHGFYGLGQVVPGTTPDACISCDVVQNSHQFVKLGQAYFYEVDLRADLARQGYLPPRMIESVSIISSGHGFEVEVMDVSLMAKE